MTEQHSDGEVCILLLLQGTVSVSLTTVGRFGDLKKHGPSLEIPDFETCEVNVVDVVLGSAQIVWIIKGELKLKKNTSDKTD